MSSLSNGIYSMTITTCADRESAKRLAHALVEANLAACVQMFPVESVYTWQGKICQDGEISVLIKSRTGLFDKIADAIKENHTYELPEIIQVPITGGLPDYLDWIGEAVIGVDRQ